MPVRTTAERDARKAQAAAPGTVRRATMALMIATAMQAFDATIANVALPQLEASLSGGIELGAWVMTSYLCASAVVARFPGTRPIAFGHLGDGNVHFNLQPPPEPAGWLAERGEEASDFVYDLVVAAGGSISAEHGIGQMKATTLARTDPPARLAALHAIKRALDPQGIMNPGKLLPAE